MINSSQIIKQIMELHKTSFDNTFNAIKSVGDQNEKILHSLIERAWMSDEHKKEILDWVDTYRKGWVDFKKAADENFKTAVKNLDAEKKTTA